MITTSTYLGSTEVTRDLLAAFSSIDHSTSAGMPREDIDRLLLRLLTRLCAIASLHGSGTPAQLLATAAGDKPVIEAISSLLESGSAIPNGHTRRELQQELVHFSRIVDIGDTGFGRQVTAGTKRLRGSHGLPESLKVLAELMVVARGRLLQHGSDLAPVGGHRHRYTRLEPCEGLSAHAPDQSPDHILVVSCARRRLRLQTAYHFQCLLSYLAPSEAFAALCAYIAELAPSHGLDLHLIWPQQHEQAQLVSFRYDPAAVVPNPFEAARNLLPAITTLPSGPELPPIVVALLQQQGHLLIHGSAQAVIATHQTADGKQVNIGTAASVGTDPVTAAELISGAVDNTMSYLAQAHVRSIECGHIHLDRQLDQDQEIGARIGGGIYQALAAHQAEAPLLTPMMDDDHVLVKLRPADYERFLRHSLDGAPLRLIPESSPIVRAIAVALFQRARNRRGQRLTRRGDNLFLRLGDGTVCELFEDFGGVAVSGCVLFEVALLVYRSDPDLFDTHVSARLPWQSHPHFAAGEILDGDEPHDIKVGLLADLYRPYTRLTDPNNPDPEFVALVEQFLSRLTEPVTHLNILEDYYEVQQGKVRQVLSDLALPIRLVTCHFNVQTGRVAMAG